MPLTRFVAALGLLAALAAPAQGAPAPSAAPSAVPMGALADLRASFNATATSVRVMTLLAPT